MSLPTVCIVLRRGCALDGFVAYPSQCYLSLFKPRGGRAADGSDAAADGGDAATDDGNAAAATGHVLRLLHQVLSFRTRKKLIMNRRPHEEGKLGEDYKEGPTRVESMDDGSMFVTGQKIQASFFNSFCFVLGPRQSSSFPMFAPYLFRAVLFLHMKCSALFE